MADFTFDAETHTYRLDGLRLPSVTEIIKPLSPDFSRIPADVLEAKRALGVAVHAACEFDDRDELDDSNTDQQVMGYVAAWRRFKSETRCSVLMNEQALYHASFRFAGTVDRVVEIVGVGKMLIDLKTAALMDDVFGVQLAGYQILLAAHINDPITRQGLRLKPDGTYQLIKYDDQNDLPCFMGLLAIHNWKESRK